MDVKRRRGKLKTHPDKILPVKQKMVEKTLSFETEI